MMNLRALRKCNLCLERNKGAGRTSTNQGADSRMIYGKPYGKLLKHKLYRILRTFGWVGYSNSFIKCLYNRAFCILIHNFLAPNSIKVFSRKQKRYFLRKGGESQLFQYNLIDRSYWRKIQCSRWEESVINLKLVTHLSTKH